MHRAYLLIVTAIFEGVTGIALLVAPSVPARLLLGVDQTSPELAVVARVAGAGLLAIGIGCWFARSDRHGSAQLGVFIGVLIYDVAAAAILAYAGSVLDLVGIALWPAVVLHSALAVWCLVSLGIRPGGP
jgi:hypothetical protein